MTIRALLPWIGAGIVSGMAILTRSTGLVLIGVAGLVLLMRLVADIRAGQMVASALRRAIVRGSVWLAATIATVFALLPALWVAPVSTLKALWAWSSNAATEGHENPTFFRGIHVDDPGLAVYPTVLAWRTSPAEWIGVALLLVFGWWAIRRHNDRELGSARVLVVALVFAAVYVAAMSIGAKKFDRYVLPVFPIIALLAAKGTSLARSWMLARGTPAWKWAGNLLVVGVILTQLSALRGVMPYRLDYYNPMLGGATEAESVLQMGWGQGGDQVVAFLLEQSVDGPITVQTSAVPSAFTYFLTTDSPVIFRSFGLGTPAGWAETDYYVAGIQQTQRGLAPWFNLLEDRQPVHGVEIGGVSYFDIYEVRSQPLPESLQATTACSYTFGGEVMLMQIIGRDNSIDLYFKTADGASGEPIDLAFTIASADGTSITHQATLSPADPGVMNRVTIPAIEGDLATASVTISAARADRALPVTAPWLTVTSAEAVTQSECYYTQPPG